MKFYKSVITVVVLLLSTYLYFSYVSYKYYNKYWDVFKSGPSLIYQFAIINFIYAESFPPLKIDEIKNYSINLMNLTKINSIVTDVNTDLMYIDRINDSINIVTKGFDRLRSFSDKKEFIQNVSFLEYSLNLRDIIIAAEPYSIGHPGRRNPKLFKTKDKMIDTVDYLSHLKYLLARERFIRFPEGFNFRAFYSHGFPKKGAFISYHLKEDSWKILWEYEGVSGQSIQLEEADIQPIINIFKTDSMFREVDSIHFPFYLPY